MVHAKNRAQRGKLWEVEELERLAKLAASGLTIPEIANVLGRSQEAVRIKGHDLALLPKRARRKPGESLNFASDHIRPMPVSLPPQSVDEPTRDRPVMFSSINRCSLKDLDMGEASREEGFRLNGCR